MIDGVAGTVCPECSGRLEDTETDLYVCCGCGQRYEVTDMYLP